MLLFVKTTKIITCERFIIYGIIHRQLETIKPKVIKSTNYKWFLRKMPEGTKINMDGRIHTTKAWRTNETFIHYRYSVL